MSQLHRPHVKGIYRWHLFMLGMGIDIIIRLPIPTHPYKNKLFFLWAPSTNSFVFPTGNLFVYIFHILWVRARERARHWERIEKWENFKIERFSRRSQKKLKNSLDCKNFFYFLMKNFFSSFFPFRRFSFFFLSPIYVVPHHNRIIKLPFFFSFPFSSSS